MTLGCMRAGPSLAPLHEPDGLVTIGGMGRKPLANTLVSPGTGAGRPPSNMAMLMLLRRMGRGNLLSERTRLMEAWAAYCAKPAKATGTVERIEGSRQVRA